MEADRDALARTLDGDERAFEELVVRYEAKVRLVARGVLRDAALAEDVAQDTFLTAYRKADTFRGDGTVKSWLLRIAVRRALDELRRRGRRAEGALSSAPEPRQRPHQALDVGWDLDAGLDRLSVESRTALLMKEVEGMSYREIADAMEWPMGTVATKLHRARMELRDALDEKRLEEKPDVVSER